MMAASSIPSLARRAAEKPKSGKDQKVDGAVFEKVDAVGKERHRSNREGDGEFNAKIRKVERGDRCEPSISGLSMPPGSGNFNFGSIARSIAASWQKHGR